jgi:hypothetical protein
MFFENDVEGYEYSGRGTGFLCRYREHDFVVTAGHVVDGFNADALRVPNYETARDFLPHNARATIKTDGDEEDYDWRDLAIFPLDRSLYTDTVFKDQPPYTILAQDSNWQPGMAGQFIMRGYLNEASPVDYDAKVLHQQPAILEADYAGVATMKRCHKITFKDVSHCAAFGDPKLALDGMSGAAVFWIGHTEPRPHCFAEVLLRATYTSGTGYFVDGRVVIAALDKILDDSPPTITK